ncbi:NrfD/PsrC family molybdoenzyme membrane anchor subunit [Caldimonas tepidiphila]|uniref:NrfD/PsrC family molybdoenzyme membrane anchor subunit n=1 Tax=Caldimonas tepidiphila TaxID=2315841 RepID=UPI000E5ACB76|nr:NrfD/PsrC family molybdoenzyme membrane anchor subunit [Caldimonas tepidiphila]
MAETRGLLHRHGRTERPPAAAGYYGLPALKPSHWKWMVAVYIWLAGIAGAVQILGALVLMIAPDREAAAVVLRPARWGALAACAIGAVLLIADLKTPRRFLYMLRIFRRTSPMSIGSWVLMAFSGLTALTVLLQLLGDLRWFVAPRGLELLVQLPAAAVGLLMATYTAPLLSATSTPLWARSPALLAGSFAAFSLAAGASALTLAGLAFGGSTFDAALEKFALLATGVAWIFVLAWLVRLGAAQLLSPLVHGGTGALFVLGVLGAGLLLPVALHLAQLFTAERLLWISALAAAGELAGSLLWRAALLLGGHASALRPADALRFAGGDLRGSAVPDGDPAEIGGRPAHGSVTLPRGEQPPQGPLPRWLIGGLSLGGLGAAFAAWMALAGLGATATAASAGDRPPDAGRVALGKQLLERYQCGSCHEIPSVPAARGRVGPPLVKFGKRAYIAGHVPNRPELLVQWIVAPHSLVPDSPMPSMGASEEDARHMAAYLRQLR